MTSLADLRRGRHFGLCIDPGMSNGICLFRWSDEGFEVVKVWQFPYGAPGLERWIDGERLREERNWDTKTGQVVEYLMLGEKLIDVLVVEKFTPHDNEGFSLTQDSVEPLRGEGVLIGKKLLKYIAWGEPSMQYFSGGDTKPEKKKRARAFLAAHDMLPTASAVGRPDADDAISATLHAIAWLRRTRHMPTLLTLFPPKGPTQ